MESKNGTDEFVTVVSVGTQPKIENFVTVLSIGTGRTEGSADGDEGQLDEEVEVYRLPGERLGFGLKFEGGNKTSERVRRLFVQSCAEHSPASRTKCSWGSLGEGDEILSIDGVPVTHMSRLDCVRHLKESQLVIKLLVRCRGALRPKVVSAERKSSPEKSKSPPELPALPPPVPPRKLRQARGSADGDANPSPVRKIKNGQGNALRGETKFSINHGNNSSPKATNHKSPEFTKSKQPTMQEPPEALVYLDARSQDGSSTHGSTSDDTGSSMSTVVDRTLTSDLFSTISTTSTALEQPNDTPNDSHCLLESFDHLDKDFCTPPGYLLKRLANSEAVTHVESRGEVGALVEKVTAVVAPNTVLIEETLTLQPPLSFQDAPLSYAHETSPGIFYTADLAADSTTHFRPICDDASMVESVNESPESPKKSTDILAPPLPLRNHINRIPVNQITRDSVSGDKPDPNETDKPIDDSLNLPPKPLPRKDSKFKRKRLPPPPPPPTAPRREAPPVPHRTSQISKSIVHEKPDVDDVTLLQISSLRKEQEKISSIVNEPIPPQLSEKKLEINGSITENISSIIDDPKSLETIPHKEDNNTLPTNKVLEIIEMKRVKAFLKTEHLPDEILNQSMAMENNDLQFIEETEISIFSSSRQKSIVESPVIFARKSPDFSSPEVWDEAREHQENDKFGESDDDDDETYASLSLIEDSKSLESLPIIITKELDDTDSSSESSEDNGDDYYWQSNLATIGEEEETPSLEYTPVNKEPEATSITAEPSEPSISHNNEITRERDDTESLKGESTKVVDKKLHKSAVNGRMDNCGGGQRLPPDGDEFPAAYQEFSASVQQYQYVVTPRTTTMITNGTINDTEKYKTSKASQVTETRITSQYIVTSKPDISLKQTDTLNKVNSHLEDSKRNPVTFTNTYTRDNKQRCVQGVVLTEKKIEIAGYYPKESKIDNETTGKDNLDSPPPLPLTGPPSYEKAMVHSRMANETCVNSRKFSLNGDLRSRDDKSEKSVRDKIAMFSKGSIESPLFPNNPAASIAVTSRRLSKYKSSEDFFVDDDNKCTTMQNDRYFSSCDLTDSAKSHSDLSISGGTERPPCPPTSSPPVESVGRVTTLSTKTSTKPMATLKSGLLTSSASLTDVKSVINPSRSNGGGLLLEEGKNIPALTRATSFSGGISYGELPPANGQVSRANSLASTFRRTEDMRRTSLNQLIEQRRKGISKLRGLVIPEKDAVPVDQPIIDLPEIKSRDSILVQQKVSIIDKWGSQGSLASNTSTQSMPIKTTTFKMPAPQILPKYSPAFKRKSLTVYGSSNVTSPSSQQTSPATTVTPTEPPKSLESICSPTRSDYSFEFVSSSVSPENIRNRPRTGQRKIRGDYDDSDNDSAVSSSQSSISRGFSPPTSPVPSDRSNLSSDRSYSIMMDTKNYLTSDGQFSKNEGYTVERNYLSSNGSSSGSSSASSSGSNSSHSDPRSPPPEPNVRFTGIPQRQMLKRSSSTETTCSTSSTLTSGSQASAESLSRRVLKPQSVEAINRKNILASARCRSGRDLNGSPLIQRKFSDDEEIPVAQRNGNYDKIPNGNCNSETTPKNIKIAYVEVIEDLVSNDEPTIVESPKYLPKRTGVGSSLALKKSPKPDIMQPSDDLKNWVRTEVEALLIEDSTCLEKVQALQTRIPRTQSSLTLDEANGIAPMGVKRMPSVEQIDSSCKKTIDSHSDDLLTTLTTKSRSRAPISFEDGAILRSKCQMSLEDILAGKAEPKRPEPHLIHSVSHRRLSVDSRDTNSIVKPRVMESEDKTFVSKIPTYGRSRGDAVDESNKLADRSRTSKIPMQRSLGRRSASVTDMKKALEKTDYSTNHQSQHGVQGIHHRCPSLDSSVEESIRPVGTENDAERFYGEQFGSISSLASSTSLISQQELALLVEEASLEEARGSHEVIVVLLHKENPSGSVGITLAGGVDCEVKEITVHRVLAHSIADRDGRVQRGDRILSINGRSTRGLSHRESLAVLKQPRSEVVLVVSRIRVEEAGNLRTRTESVETIVEGFESNGMEDTAWGPPTRVIIFKDGAGLGFSLEGGRDSPLGDRALVIKKIFTGGAAEKTGALTAGDQLLEVNGSDVTRLSRIEAWSLMKKLQDGEVNLLVRHPATKSS
uniref:IL16_0 protein n=2 Tax=Fopius arisanus TaxID=64838 RepID=A0A0C9RA28_9HYME